MKSLFRNFSRSGVRFLLIGGQATVVYGAAQFTQDFDLWVEPSPANRDALIRALARSVARVHKLTPPLTVQNLRRGHGFHFLIPDQGIVVPLDVMGRPPRVGAWPAAARRARVTNTPWGRIPVVSPVDLVNLKRTNRPGDYAVAARLARLVVRETPRPSPALLVWAAENTLDVEELASLIQQHRAAFEAAAKKLPPAARLLLRARSSTDRSYLRAEAEIHRSLARALRTGREYWTPILAELRALRSDGRLLPEGLEVRSLLPGA
ncbi:MAG: hypothetical protein HUU15_01170 [Candidatus Brocadiae bacterium]|nr:hypothetical protein [Candidatus Brocadiia bacterium]